MKKNPRKLKLESETLRNLDNRSFEDREHDLKQVIGRRPPTTGYHHSCYDC